MADLTFPATLVRWVDGDTATVTVPIGQGLLPDPLTATVKIRLRSLTGGIDCPKAGTPDGDAATARSNTLAPAGSPIVLHVFGHDEYARALAALVTPGGVDVGAELVAEGHAVPWDGHGPHPPGGG